MDYKKEYEQAFERAKGIYDETIVPTPTAKGTCEYIFPELKENEDERIRKALVKLVKKTSEGYENVEDGVSVQDAIAWLEKQSDYNRLVEEIKERKELLSKEKEKATSSNDKLSLGGRIAVLEELLAFTNKNQDEQKRVNKVKPKFKVGDWIVSEHGNVNTVNQVINVEPIDDEYFGYTLDDKTYFGGSWESSYRLWTINDAKDGDVLAASDGSIFIFKEIVDCGCKHYIALEKDNETINVNDNLKHFWEADSGVKPSTKKQRDLLFQKMKETGYEWNSENKELRKIEQKTEINDNVLSRFAFYQYDNDTIYLSSVFVEECNRKRGYGSKILKAAEEVAKTLGISKIRLKVERNTWMEEWYKKNGYEYLSPDGEYNWLEKRVDNLEPMFNVGDWVVCCNYEPEQIIGIRNYMYEMSNGDIRPINMINNNHNIRLWTIQDAKDGDVLAAHDCLVLFKEIDGLNIKCHCTYHYMNNVKFYVNTLHNKTAFCPATKEQCDLLFQKMKEAGYEWNAEKKELKKVEVKFKVGDVMRTLQEASDGFTDGMPVVVSIDNEYYHCNNELIAIKNQDDYEYPPINRRQNLVWSEEDEEMIKGLNNCLSELEEKCGWRYTYVNYKDVELDKIRNWLKFLKDRVQPQPKQEWSKEDEKHKDALISLINEIKNQPLTRLEDWDGYIDWLKSLKNSVKQQPKQDWSEEDERERKRVIGLLEGWLSTFKETCYAEDCKRGITWLKSIKPQPKQQWSEEDEEILNSAISLAYDVEDIDMYNWLKSLKERYTWKPSDEQMEALLKLEEMHVLEHEKNQENAHLYMVIKSLKEQLFKLKGE